uniref:Uncharacterized protein n=1 Tax=Trichogramma kaykai TaxID=54128 RepID=A0ABD2XF66_9HYME
MSATATRPVDIPAPLNIIYGTSRELASCSCGMMHLTKRIEEVRLLESRKSARLADSDTDFARLADVGSDRKRASSHSIDVSTFIGSRKRRPSSSNDSERSYNAWNDSTNNNNNNNNNSSHNHNHHQQQHHNNNNRQTSVVTSTQAQSPVAVAPVQATQTSTGGGSSATTTGAMNLSMTASSGGSEPQETVYMDECSAAMVLMSLSTPPKNPLPIHCQQSYGSWDDGISNRVTIGSPGTNSSQSSSSASWRSATPSPPLSDDPISHSAAWAAAHPNNHHNNHHQLQHQQQHHHHNNHHSQTHQSPGQVPVVDQRRFYHRQHHPYAVVHRSSSHRRHRGGGLSSSSSSPNNSPYDEGIVPDLDQERPRKKRIRSIENDEDYMSANNTGSSSDNDVVRSTFFYSSHILHSKRPLIYT